MAASSEEHPKLVDVVQTEFVDEPDVYTASMKISEIDPTDIAMRLAALEEAISPMVQRGYGHLWIVDLPSEDTSSPTPRLRWKTTDTLTCQTSHGRNLQLRGFSLDLWRDARFTFAGQLFNVSRHSNWDVTFSVEVWFRTGHETRPRATQRLAGVTLSHGKALAIDSKGYSDALAALYSQYRGGELALRFRIDGIRNN